MTPATTKDRQNFGVINSRMTRDEMSSILAEHGVGRLLILLRDAEYDVDDVIAAIDRHQESASSRAKRIMNAVIDTVFLPS